MESPGSRFDYCIDLGMKSLAVIMGLYAVHVLGEIKRCMDSLDQKMARIVERSEWHAHEIDGLQEQLRRLEDTL